MKTTNNILLVRAPAEVAMDGRELRDYILDSLPLGVLVLPDDVSCEVMELPPLGDGNVEVTIADPAITPSDAKNIHDPC